MPHLKLPPGLYRHRAKFRAYAYVDQAGVRHKKPGPGRKRGWIYFDPPESRAAAEFYRWIETPQPGESGEMAKACQAYLKNQFKRLADATQRTERPRIERLMKVFGHMSICDIRPKHINQYLMMRPDAPMAVKKDIKRLSAMFTYWVAAELAPSNPCTAVLKVQAQPDRARTRYVTDQEFDQALAVALDRAFHVGHSGSIVYAVLILELLTGRRESDILRLKRNDLGDEGVLCQESKTGQASLIVWTDDLRDAVARVKSMMPRGLFLITNRDGNEVSQGSLNQAWQRMRPLMTEAGIAPFQLRDIRAKHATDFQGDASANLRHSSAAVTRKHYVRKPQKVVPLR